MAFLQKKTPTNQRITQRKLLHFAQFYRIFQDHFGKYLLVLFLYLHKSQLGFCRRIYESFSFFSTFLPKSSRIFGKFLRYGREKDFSAVFVKSLSFSPLVSSPMVEGFPFRCHRPGRCGIIATVPHDVRRGTLYPGVLHAKRLLLMLHDSQNRLRRFYAAAAACKSSRTCGYGIMTDSKGRRGGGSGGCPADLH